MIRDAASCLRDMQNYACDVRDDVRDFVAGMDEAAFLQDRKTQFAVLRGLEVIGEAAKRVPSDAQARFADIPWREIIGVRNIIAHDYLGVSPSMVFVTASSFVPRLIAALGVAPAQLENG